MFILMTTLGQVLVDINVGDTQTFTFQPGDDGPFWMTEEERELNRHDRILLPAPPGNPPI